MLLRSATHLNMNGKTSSRIDTIAPTHADGVHTKSQTHTRHLHQVGGCHSFGASTLHVTSIVKCIRNKKILNAMACLESRSCIVVLTLQCCPSHIAHPRTSQLSVRCWSAPSIQAASCCASAPGVKITHHCAKNCAKTCHAVLEACRKACTAHRGRDKPGIRTSRLPGITRTNGGCAGKQAK